MALLHGSVVWRRGGGRCRRAGPSLTADNSPGHSKRTKIAVIASRSSATECELGRPWRFCQLSRLHTGHMARLSSSVRRPPGCRARSPFGACDGIVV